MKLSSFFVAVMVITSVNAGLGDGFRKKINNLRIKLPSVALSSEPSSPSASNSMSDTVQEQVDASPILDHMFDGNEEHNGMLMKLFNLQALFFVLTGRIEHEFSSHSTPVELNENPTQAELEGALNLLDSDQQDIPELIVEMYECLSEFETLMSQYLGKYVALPKGTVIVSSEVLQRIAESLKKDIDLTDWT
ncbi:hypothetical protein BASA81_004267 [Batrachochytrium salamandrivorans]|nr:hypothetical protein BASA62_006403 [Batrachochytrium salamandrivorans]KAH9257505.1 hypothetical protein BASA81_004267 [Batrachochytrium salamandrivorans]